MKVLQFLNGLSTEYESVKDQILLIDPVPSVDKCFAMILRVEKKHHTSISDYDNVLAVTAS
ncbi:hypothetical protein PSY31_23735, partial [Shigella flexneri]|nr:hypothetical protein [Shigella flexneri]